MFVSFNTQLQVLFSLKKFQSTMIYILKTYSIVWVMFYHNMQKYCEIFFRCQHGLNSKVTT